MTKQKLIIKNSFLERYKKLTNYDKFMEYSLKFPKRSIRVNTIKISVNELKKRLEKEWKLTQIPWCNEGFWIEGIRRDIGNLIEHRLGYIYIQEPASMIPPIVLEPTSNDLILDIAASPGSKTTQIASMMKNKGLIVANDVDYTRIKALSINLQRCGVANTIITLMHGASFRNFKFDKILLDAPCSGTGTIRKSLKTLQMYNPKMVIRLSNLQKKLISATFENLKEKGTLVYSTCSLEPEENESVIDFLLNKYKNAKLEKIKLKLKSSEPIIKFENSEYSKEILKCLRLWPQDNDTDGFFVAKIKKL